MLTQILIKHDGLYSRKIDEIEMKFGVEKQFKSITSFPLIIPSITVDKYGQGKSIEYFLKDNFYLDELDSPWPCYNPLGVMRLVILRPNKHIPTFQYEEKPHLKMYKNMVMEAPEFQMNSKPKPYMELEGFPNVISWTIVIFNE